jgi:hypothetical protein
MVKKTDEKPRVGDGTPGPGRPKGMPNKTTKLLKDAIIQAAEAAGNKIGSDGLVSYLTNVAEENQPAFCSLLGKVLPMQVTGEGGGPVQVTVQRFTADATDTNTE